MTWKDGTTYVGKWKLGKMHGKGTLIDAEGVVYKGRWENDILVKQL